MNCPIYQEALNKNLPKGLYLALFHGRNTADEEMTDWGFNGPMIGPLKYVHTTYGQYIKMEFEEGHEEHIKVYSSIFQDAGGYTPTYPELFTNTDNTLIMCDGKFYGDWLVFYNNEGK